MRFRAVFLLVVACGAVVAQGDPYLATVSGDKVRLRGGPADFHAILDEMAKGTPVRVVGSEGDWKRVEVPGGFDVFVAAGKKGRPYLDTSKPEGGIVLVDDLMIRGTSSTDFPPLGRLGAGDRVVVLDVKDGWVRLLSPTAAHSWIHGKFIARADDQAATLAAFDAKHASNRQALLAAGSVSRELLKRQKEAREQRARIRAVVERYEAEGKKPWDQRDISGTRKALLELRDGLPEGAGDRVSIVAMLKSLDDWEGAAADLTNARKRLAAAKKEAEQAEKTYRRRIRDLKTEVETQGKDAAASQQLRYRTQGHVRRMVPIDGLRSEPTWAVSTGGRPSFYLDGDRYNWAEYEGKLIGVLEAEDPETRLGLNVRVIKVSKIEILDG
jgi:uncharacterized protein YgiM (DUF1202 family)